MTSHIALAAAYVSHLESRIVELESTLVQYNKAIETLSSSDSELYSPEFTAPAHIRFVRTLKDKKNSLEYVMTEHLRVQGAFWTLGSLDLLNAERSAEEEKELIEWVFTCYDQKRGGFGGNTKHDAHLLYTQHAIYVLAQLHALPLLDRVPPEFDALDPASPTYKHRVVSYVKSMQAQDSGAFKGDEWGEIDTRFTYCAAVTLAVLGKLDVVNKTKAIDYILSTRNELDGGFGCTKNVESHGGYVFTALGALSVLGGLHRVENWDALAWWLAERQCDSGGLNGRPEKLADVCYSWWILSSLYVLNRMDWIDGEKLVQFILQCQDPMGGIGDHPNNVGDVYHTFFGLCGLFLLGYLKHDQGFGEVDPVYALPKSVVKELGLTFQRVER